MKDMENGAANQPMVPDYELLRRIGGGAYGEVFLARSKATGILRAAKIVSRQRFDDDRPFQREFEGLERFERISREHPSQLSLFHIGRNDTEGYFYYIMELADDVQARKDTESYTPRTLRAELAQGRLPTVEVLEIGLALTEALGHLHRNGLVHRDVKPSNVIFVNGRPKLADIGLVTDASDSRSIVGTEGYLPPEGPGTPQGDIFALGKVLYEAATGLDRREFPKLPENLRSWPDAAQVFELNEIILKACAQDSEHRYRTCDELYADLALLEQGKSVRQKRTRQQLWAAGKKAGLALIALAAVAALLFILPRQSTRSKPSSNGADSTNLEANALCDKAMYILRGDDTADFGAAYTNFNEAIALDPNFARPYVGLLELGLREHVPGVDTRSPEKLRAISHHLEQLAPHLAATYVAQAAVNYSDGHYPEAEHLLLEAIKADPNYELSHTWYSWLLVCFGRPEESRKQLEIARALAPSKAIIYHAIGHTYYAERDYSNAISWYKTAIKWSPHLAFEYSSIANSLRAMGDYTNALTYFEQTDILGGEDEAVVKRRYAELRRALDQGGVRGFWLQHWKWKESETNTDFYWKAVIQIQLGNTNAAMDWLQKSYEAREHFDYESALDQLLFDDYWDSVHEDPRFKHLLDESGLSKVMPSRKK